MEDLKKIQEFFSKPLKEENQPQFKKGDKVTYLGHPAEITAINKEMTGEITYSVAYDKGQGRTKASNINLKSGAIKPLEEANLGMKEPAHLEKVKNIVNSLPHRYNVKPDRLGMVKVTSRSKDELGALKTELDKANLYSQMRSTLAGMFELTISGGPMNEANESEYTVAGHSVTINKNNTEDQTKWTVTFTKNNKTVPYTDVLALIKPRPALKEAKGKYKIAYNGKGFYGITNGGKIEGEYSKEEAQKKADEKNKSMNEASKEEETEFHKKLDKLVHKTFGKRKDEMEEAYSGFLRNPEDPDSEPFNPTGAVAEFREELRALFGKFKDDLRNPEFIKGVAEVMVNWKSLLRSQMDETTLTEAYVPQNIKEFAKRKGVSSLVNKVAGWAEKAGARITGGTAIGKNYDTLILDMGYQTADIYINCEEETVELYGEEVYDFKSFYRVFIEEESRKQAEHDEEILRREQGLEEGMGGQLDEPFFIQVSVRDARKAMDMFDDMYRNSNIKTYGSDVYAANTPEDIYDFFYDLNSNGIEVLDANVEGDENDFDTEYERTLRETIKFIKENNPKATKEEVIAELKEIKKLGTQLNEELCEKGKRYIAARQAAGEKSSAYLSGRGVKVCNGSIEWPKKGKKKK
jgi:hypothetical protein